VQSKGRIAAAPLNQIVTESALRAVLPPSPHARADQTGAEQEKRGWLGDGRGGAIRKAVRKGQSIA